MNFMVFSSIVEDLRPLVERESADSTSGAKTFHCAAAPVVAPAFLIYVFLSANAAKFSSVEFNPAW